MFEHMKIAESIYESVVTPYFKKLLGHKPTILESVGIERIRRLVKHSPRKIWERWQAP